MRLNKITRVLISVTDKAGIAAFAISAANKELCIAIAGEIHRGRTTIAGRAQ